MWGGVAVWGGVGGDRGRVWGRGFGVGVGSVASYPVYDDVTNLSVKTSLTLL